MRSLAALAVSALRPRRPPGGWRLLAWPTLVLGVGCLLTWMAASATRERLDHEARQEFDRLVEHVGQEAERRMNLPLHGLKGALGMYAGQPQLSLAQFRAYVQARDLGHEFPGVRGFGYIERVPRAELGRHAASARRADGLPFEPRSNSTGADLYLIRYIEPAARNPTARGFDLGSEAVRRAAVERAVSSGEPTLSGKIRLIQDQLHRPGFVFLLPVYQAGSTPSGKEDRVRTLRGLLYAPIQADELFAGLVDTADRRLDFKVFDGLTLDPSDLVFDFDHHLSAAAGAVAMPSRRRFESVRPIAVGGRTLALHASSTPIFDAAFADTATQVVGGSGLLISLLAGFAAWLLAAGRARVVERARELTADLDRLAQVVQRTSSSVIITDLDHRIVWVNPGFSRIAGYTLAEARGRNPAELLTGADTAPAAVEMLQAAIKAGQPCRVEVLNRARDGSNVWFDVELQPMRDDKGRVAGFMQIGTDITALKLAGERLQAAMEGAAAMSSELQLLAKVAKYTSNAVIVTDAKRRIRWVNEGFCRITGYGQQEVLGRSPGRLLQCPDTDTQVVARLREALDAGRGFRGELLNRAKDGREYWIDIEMQPLRGPDGALVGFMAIESDVTERRRADVALGRERVRLANILDGTHAGDGEWNLQTGEIVLSPRWAAMLGWTLAELCPLTTATWVGFVHPDDVPVFEGAVQRHVRGETPRLERQIRMRHREGHWLAIELRGRVSSRTPDGKAEWLSGTHIDVTPARREAQRWQARAELSGDWFWQTDTQHRFVEIAASGERAVAANAERMMHLRRDEIAWIRPPEGDADWGAFHARLDRREAFQAVSHRAFPEGSEDLWLEIDGRPRYDDAGAFLGYEGVGRDVTERRRITDNLRASLTLIDALFEGIPVPVVLKDERGRYLRMNRAYAELFGAEASDVQGKTAQELIDAEAAARHDAEDALLLQSPGTRSYEVHQRLSGGRSIDALVCKSTLLDGEGQVLGLIGTVVDIGEQKQMQRAAAEAKEAAEAANRAKSAFLATMSHEIRTPMNGVLGMAELLAHSRLDEEQAQTVQTLRDSAQALLRLVDDILDFSKIEAGRLELEEEPVALTALAEGVCDALLAVASDKRVALHLFVDPVMPDQVRADPVRVRQLLNNLIGNAIKFGAGRPDRLGHVTVRLEPDGGGLRFSVEDDGIGMDEATQARLFRPFVQAEASTTRRYGGTGLGLAICRRLVDLMAGRIEVSSKPGRGSRFTVWLPLRPTPEQPAPGTSDLSGLNCMLVPDAELPTEDLEAWLRQAGASVHRADTAAAAAAAARSLSPPTVLIQTARPDGRTVLPELEGLDLRHLLVGRGRRGQARHVAPRVVALDCLRRAPFTHALAQLAGRATNEAASTRGGGELPMSELRAAPELEEARARGQLILVAEDDATNRAVIVRQLAILGYAAEVTENGSEALQKWRSGGHALLLSDVHMPDMDGLELARTIRSEEARAGRGRMPIIALSANALRGAGMAARAHDMDDFLTKPVPLKVLLAALKQWMPVAAAPEVSESDLAPEAQGRVVLDLDVLRALVGDDEETVRELLSDFLDAASHEVQELQIALQAGDRRHVAAIAHKLKSASRSIGALALGELCADLERQPADSDPRRVAPTLARFESTFCATVAQIEVHNGVFQP